MRSLDLPITEGVDVDGNIYRLFIPLPTMLSGWDVGKLIALTRPDCTLTAADKQRLKENIDAARARSNRDASLELGDSGDIRKAVK